MLASWSVGIGTTIGSATMRNWPEVVGVRGRLDRVGLGIDRLVVCVGHRDPQGHAKGSRLAGRPDDEVAGHADLDRRLPRSGRVALARRVADVELVAHRSVVRAADPVGRTALGDIDLGAGRYRPRRPPAQPAFRPDWRGDARPDGDWRPSSARPSRDRYAATGFAPSCNRRAGRGRRARETDEVRSCAWRR